MNGIVIQPVAVEDLPEVVALERASYADPWSATAFAGLPGHPAVHFPVVRIAPGEPVVGYAVAWFAADEGELANLAVAPAFRRRGLGQRLLDSVLEEARARGVREVFLEVRESNAAARELYASRNFEEVGRRKRYYRSPEEDALILRRTLKR